MVISLLILATFTIEIRKLETEVNELSLAMKAQSKAIKVENKVCFAYDGLRYVEVSCSETREGK
jgi:hypothetical protein